MNERLVDVLDVRDKVLHVFPIAVEDGDGAAQDAECVREALRTAVHLHLVPEAEVGSLRGRIHVSRGGQLAPLGDALLVRQQAQERAEQRVRVRAYFLWKRDGFPKHPAEAYWYQAREIEDRGPPR